MLPLTAKAIVRPTMRGAEGTGGAEIHSSRVLAHPQTPGLRLNLQKRRFREQFHDSSAW